MQPGASSRPVGEAMRLARLRWARHKGGCSSGNGHALRLRPIHIPARSAAEAFDREALGAHVIEEPSAVPAYRATHEALPILLERRQRLAADTDAIEVLPARSVDPHERLV